MLFIKVTALLVLVCLSFCAAEIRNTFNKYEVISSLSVHVKVEMDDNLFARILCENTTKASKPTKCLVSQETLDGKYKAVRCEVELDNYVNYDRFVLSNFNKDKVVLSWWSESEAKEHQFIRHSIVHLQECKVFEANIDLKARDYSEESWHDLGDTLLIRDDGSFDVFYYTMDSQDIRRVTFNAQGKIVSGPIDSFDLKTNLEGLTVGLTSQKDLHTAVFEYSDRYEFTLFKDDGSWDVIKSFGEGYKSFNVAANDGTIRSCSVKENSSDLVCKVFNQNENSTTTYKLAAYNDKDFFIHNLVKNEFLMLYPDSEGMHIAKYGADGKQHGKLDIIKECKRLSKTVGLVLTSMYSNGDEVCATRLCINEEEYDLTNYCFESEDVK